MGISVLSLVGRCRLLIVEWCVKAYSFMNMRWLSFGRLCVTKGSCYVVHVICVGVYMCDMMASM